MSRYSGPQYRGASRDAKQRRREEAALRQLTHHEEFGYIKGSWPRDDGARVGRKLRESRRIDLARRIAERAA